MNTGVYGPNYTRGVLSGTRLERGESLRILDGAVVVKDHNDYWEPVLCGELVEILTEDGPVTGRCGSPIVGGVEGFACEGHTQQINGWRAQSELETIEWERRQEELGC